MYRGKVLTGGLPVRDITVSDGKNAVKTDSRGEFELPGWERARFVFITVPDGFATPDPDSFAQEVRGEEAEYVFELKKTAPTGKHCFFHFSDTEIGMRGTGEWIFTIRELIKSEKPAFIIHTGDICRRTGLITHKGCMNSYNMGCRVIYTLGNHDYSAYNADGSASPYGEHLFESIYGPLWYSFELGNIHYVVSPIQGGEAAGGYQKGDLWRWLRNDLALASPGKRIILFNHNCSQTEDGYTASYEDTALDLRQYPLAAWIFGHYHSDFINDNDGILNICTARPGSGGIDHTPSGIRRVTVSAEGDITSRIFYYKETAEKQVGCQWRTQLPARTLFGSPLLCGDTLYIPAVDDGYPKSCGIYALNAADGKIIRSFPTENSVKTTPVIHGDILVAFDCGGTLYFYDKNTGKLLKTATVPFKFPRMSETRLACADGKVYAGSAGTMAAFDIESGERLWLYGPSGGEPSPTGPVICGNLLICGSQWSRLFALDRATGEQLWENRGAKIRFRSSLPLIIGNKLLVASNDTVHLIDGATGRTIGGLTLQGANLNVSSRPLLRGKTAYFATADRGLISIDITSLLALPVPAEDVTEFTPVTPVATCKTDEAIVFTSPYTGAGSRTVEGDIYSLCGMICFAASDGCLRLLEADTLKPVRTVSFGSPFFNSPAFIPDPEAPTGMSAALCALSGAVYRVKL